MNPLFPAPASVRHLLVPHTPSRVLILSLFKRVVADERYWAAKHTAQGTSNDGGRSSTANYYYFFVRRNRVRSNGLPLPRPSHRPDIRLSVAPGPPADGMSPGRAACPRIAVRVPRCVIFCFVEQFLDLKGGCVCFLDRRACRDRVVPARHWPLFA
jgi:hypothetical protein